MVWFLVSHNLEEAYKEMGCCIAVHYRMVYRRSLSYWIGGSFHKRSGSAGCISCSRCDMGANREIELQTDGKISAKPQRYKRFEKSHQNIPYLGYNFHSVCYSDTKLFPIVRRSYTFCREKRDIWKRLPRSVWSIFAYRKILGRCIQMAQGTG